MGERTVVFTDDRSPIALVSPSDKLNLTMSNLRRRTESLTSLLGNAIKQEALEVEQLKSDQVKSSCRSLADISWQPVSIIFDFVDKSSF